MDQIVVAPALGEQLEGVAGQVVVCDAAGRVLGFFSPLPERRQFDDLQLEPPLSLAETEQLRQNNRTGKPLEEILRRHGL
jgi:hypothetical protein